MELFFTIILPVSLLVIGLMGLYKGKIKISGSRILSGAPVYILSVCYIGIAVATFVRSTSQFDLPTIGLLIVVTLITVLFGSTPIRPRFPPSGNTFR